MPIRVYRCREGHETEAMLPFGDYPKTAKCRWCPDPAAKSVPTGAAVSTSIPQQIAALKKRGLIPYEKGMERDAASALESKQARHERTLSRVVDDVIRERQDIRPD